MSPNFGFSLNPSVGGRYQELVLLNARDPFSTCIWHQPLSKNLRANARLFTVVHHEILKGIYTKQVSEVKVKPHLPGPVDTISKKK